jgi:hypothetical protein
MISVSLENIEAVTEILHACPIKTYPSPKYNCSKIKKAKTSYLMYVCDVI